MITDTTNGKVHLCQTIGCRFRLLSIHIHCLGITTMCLDELSSLNKHTTRTATRVIDSTIERLNEGCYQLYDAMRGIELAFFLVSIDRESLQEVFIHTTYQVVFYEAFRVYLLYLVNYTFQHTRLQLCLGENLLWQSILQFWFIIVKHLDSSIESNCHTCCRSQNQVVPESLFTQEEYTILQIVLRTLQLHLDETLIINALLLESFTNLLLLLLESLTNKFQEYQCQQQVTLIRHSSPSTKAVATIKEYSL